MPEDPRTERERRQASVNETMELVSREPEPDAEFEALVNADAHHEWDVIEAHYRDRVPVEPPERPEMERQGLLPTDVTVTAPRK